MTQTASLALADRLALIIEGLCQTIARRLGLGGLAGPLIILLWSRLRRIAARFTRAAMTPPAPARLAPKRPARARQPCQPPLPRRKAWLLRLMPETASGASQLRHFLADPEVASLLAADPRLRRILRPLCRMLGIRLAPEALAPASPPAAQPRSSTITQAPPPTPPPATPPALSLGLAPAPA